MLLNMHKFTSSGSSWRGLPSGINKISVHLAINVFEDCLNVWFNKGPEALVLVFFLRPHDLCSWILPYLLFDQIPWEGTQLFDPSDGHLFLESSGCPLLRQFIVSLSGTEHQSLDTRRVFRGRSGVRDDSLELSSLNHLIERGLGIWMSQQRLGSEHDHRFPEGHDDLSS